MELAHPMDHVKVCVAVVFGMEVGVVEVQGGTVVGEADAAGADAFAAEPVAVENSMGLAVQ